MIFTRHGEDGVQIEQTRNGVTYVIVLNAQSVVRAARSLLYAAGFKTIGIHTHEDRGNVDVEDGDEARQFLRASS